MRQVGSRSLSQHEREVLRVDLRWLLAWTLSFLGSLAFVFVLYAIYKATGPHPQVTVFLRRVKHHVRWLIPGLKHKPNARDEALGLELDRARHVTLEYRSSA